MASIENIKGSDGSGNASMATVQSTRAPLASTIIVDTVLGINGAGFMGSMGTPHTFTDPVTSEEITVISEATAVDFSGHVDGSNLEIDDIAPGYTDNGSEVGDIIVIRPTTQWADEVASILEVIHEDDGTLKDDVVDTAAIQDDAVTTDKIDDEAVTPDKLSAFADGASVATSESTTSTSYTDLATSGPAVTVNVGAKGRVLIAIKSYIQHGAAAGNTGWVSVALSGANTLAASDANALMYQPWTTNAFHQGGVTFILEGLTPGSTTFTLKYRGSSANTSTFQNRKIAVIPL